MESPTLAIPPPPPQKLVDKLVDLLATMPVAADATTAWKTLGLSNARFTAIVHAAVKAGRITVWSECDHGTALCLTPSESKSRSLRPCEYGRRWYPEENENWFKNRVAYEDRLEHARNRELTPGEIFRSSTLAQSRKAIILSLGVEFAFNATEIRKVLGVSRWTIQAILGPARRGTDEACQGHGAAGYRDGKFDISFTRRCMISELVYTCKFSHSHIATCLRVSTKTVQREAILVKKRKRVQHEAIRKSR